MTNRMEKTDITEGPLFKNLVLFSLPLILSGLLQLLYNAADLIVVGQKSEDAIAAIGGTSALINLILNLSLGLSAGASVTTAYFFGAKNSENLSKVVHTSLVLSLLCGVIFGVIGLCFSKVFLLWMDTPLDVIDSSSLYMKIYFAGLPATMVYNFGSAILRSTGDTKRPLIFLSISGLINVGLNLVFVFCFNMIVSGVALATVISQIISAAMIVIYLLKVDSPIRLSLRKLKLDKEMFFRILRIGIPSGIQGMIFSLSNVIIQKSINFLEKFVMAGILAGSSAAHNIEGFVYIAMNALHHTSLTFTSQNIGSGHTERIRKVLLACVLLVSGIGIVLGGLSYIFGRPLLGIYLPNAPISVEAGLLRLQFIAIPYFLCGCMEVFTGAIRGMGSSIYPMMASIFGVCGIRILWIYTIFKKYPTQEILYVSYPISWLFTCIALLIGYIIIRRRLIKKQQCSLA